MAVTKTTNRRYAFTLIELMVSIFLMLLIMVGVNSVFSATSATVGTSTAISAANRDARAVQTVLNRDFGSAVQDNGTLIIRGEQLFAFANQRDFSTDPTSGNVQTVDLTSSGTETTIPAAQYGSRSHRLDRISMMTRQLLRRQTGNAGVFAANQACMEQWIWLGHLRIPDNSVAPNLLGSGNDAIFLAPGAGANLAANPNNYYANQWTLGRIAVNLVSPTVGVINDSSTVPVSQNYIQSNGPVGALDVAATSTNLNGEGSYAMRSSRYDLAGTTIDSFSSALSNYIDPTPLPLNWWPKWWLNMMGGPLEMAAPVTPDRFSAVPFGARPLQSKNAAWTSPILATGVSQFVVEYAGDFLNQNSAGQVTDTYMRCNNIASLSSDTVKPTYVQGTTDGLIDFVVPTAGANTGQRQIRWYGLPRSTSGNANITAANGDVVPLRDLWQTSSEATLPQANGFAPFERISVAGTTNIIPTSTPRSAPANYAASMVAGAFYQTAWAPSDTNRPKLIRITMTLEDPNNRLVDGQTYEYVFAVGN